jgi:hypothetical protein
VRITAGVETLTVVSEISKLVVAKPPADETHSIAHVAFDPCEGGGVQIEIELILTDWKIDVTTELTTVAIPPAAINRDVGVIPVTVPEVETKR